MNIETLIEKLTTNGEEELNPEHLLFLKEYCKVEHNNNEVFKYLYRLLLFQLKKNHAQIRYGTFLVINYLFEKSHSFRLIICKNLNSLFELCLDVKYNTNDSTISYKSDDKDLIKLFQNSSSLQPKSWAKKLRNKMLDCFRYWHDKFGRSYSLLRKYHEYLVERRIYENLSSTSSSPSYNNDLSSKRVISTKTIEQLSYKFEELENDINLLIVQIDSCFELLIPKINLVEETNNKNANNEYLNFRPMQGLSFNIILVSKIEIIHDSSNTNLINNLKEFCKELCGLKQKLKLFEAKFKKFQGFGSNELENRIKTLLMKVEHILSKENDIKIIESETPRISQCNTEFNDANDDQDRDDFEEVIETEDQFLLAKMEQKEKSLLETKSKANDDGKQQMKNETKINSLARNNQCRALLPSGRLCPRRDFINCPFHGKIVPRDEKGLPLDSELKKKELEIKYQRESNEWKDPRYLKILSEKIGKDLQLNNHSKKRKKFTNLIDIKQLNSTPKQRLKSKLGINKKFKQF